MPDPRLEHVFKTSGVPTYTFVQPQEYTQLLVALRSPGRGVVIEGPSGIGKTTAVESALKDLGIVKDVAKLSARKPADIEYIEALPTLRDPGVVVVDDFHKLPDNTRSRLADYLKALADEESKDAKLIVLGINRAGENLISFAHDLVNRVDIIPFEANPDEKVRQLLKKGQDALNIEMNVSEDIVKEARGSFYLAQMLAREVCVQANALEANAAHRELEVSFPSVRSKVWDRLGLAFKDRCARFCRGNKLRPEGRAPYLHILNWLATSSDWTISLPDAIRRHPALRGSVGQVVEKDYLRDIIAGDNELKAVLHFDDHSEQLTVEDPQFLFYIRNIPWKRFARDIGFLAVDFPSKYDFALSFAGTDRPIAKALFEALQEYEVEVFYDHNEQHRILAEDVEEYLKPIYQSEAAFVLVLLGPDYPKRIWTKIESDAFRERLGDGSVIPIWFTTAPPGMFDETARIGGFAIDPTKELAPQITELRNLLIKKLRDNRQ